jgi:hypothetical protein
MFCGRFAEAVYTFLTGFCTGAVTAIGGLLLAGRVLRQHRLQQQVDAGAGPDLPVAQGSPLSWQEAQDRLAVLRWRPAHWGKTWPEA